MKNVPQFPEFKLLSIDDRDTIHPVLWQYQPETAEFTFTNIFGWRHFYETQWTFYKDWLIFLFNPMKWGYYFLQPIGPSSRIEVVSVMMDYLRKEKDQPDPRIDRVDALLVAELEGTDWSIENLRDQYDYVYETQALISLSGRKYHKKKNHVNRFMKNYHYRYAPMEASHAEACKRVLRRWCNWRECEKNPVMLAEFKAVEECLTHFDVLQLKGGVIFVEDQIEAFSIGELLNKNTAVIHIEKADPEIPEAFAVINQQFCKHAWHDISLINREQDLGNPGLRKAKESYHPVKMICESRIRLPG